MMEYQQARNCRIGEFVRLDKLNNSPLPDKKLVPGSLYEIKDKEEHNSHNIVIFEIAVNGERVKLGSMYFSRS